jgi:FKBP-type peptidyl-prolyl cis-trans isomerase
MLLKKMLYNFNKIKMIKFSSFVLATATIAMLAACNNPGYKKTSSGLRYKIISSGKAPMVKRGDILKINYTEKIGDSLLSSSYGKMPAYAKVDSVEGQYSPVEIFRFLHKGDSVTVVQLVDSIMKKAPTGLPPYMKKGGQITTSFKVVEVYSSEEAARADAEGEMAKEKGRRDTEIEAASGKQIKEMQDYLAKKNINAQKTGKGTYVAIQNPGDGPAAEPGKYVSVRYTGKLLEGDKVFESNMTNGQPPYSFVLGTGNVIKGWDEGLQLLKKGGKATLYIPGFLAYGPDPGPGGKPYEALIFDVELVDVTNTPPQMDPRAMMPPQPGGNPDPRSQQGQR